MGKRHNRGGGGGGAGNGRAGFEDWRKEQAEEADAWRRALPPAGGAGGTTTPTPQAPPDPNIIKAVTDYRIARSAADLENLNKPTTWVMTAKGIVPVKMLPLGIFVGGPSGHGAPGLIEVKAGVKLNIPLLPWEHFAAVIAFFKDINTKRHAEAMVQFFWDPDGEGGVGNYIAHAPDQDISGGGVRHLSEFDKDGKYLHVLDIHSHNSMSAFWSGTDDGDEKRFEGRLYGVVGKVGNPIPEWKWRTHVGGAFIDLSLDEIVDLSSAPEVRIERTFKASDLLSVAGKNSDNNTFVFTYDPFKEGGYPKEWEEATKVKVVHGVVPGDNTPGSFSYRGPGAAGGGVTIWRSAAISAEDRKVLEDAGCVEVRPGQWCQNPDFPQAMPLFTPLTGGASQLPPQREAWLRKDLNGGVDRREPTASTGSGTAAGPTGTSTGTSPAGSAGSVYKPRVEFVYDRVTGRLYAEDPDGTLYPSYLDLVEVAKRFPSNTIKWVSGVDTQRVSYTVIRQHQGGN